MLNGKGFVEVGITVLMNAEESGDISVE